MVEGGSLGYFIQAEEVIFEGMEEQNKGGDELGMFDDQKASL